MRAQTGTARSLACFLALALVTWPAVHGGEEEAAEPAGKKPPARSFAVETFKGDLFVAIQKLGEVAQGECFEVRRGEQLVGYAEAAELVEGRPKLAFLLGAGRPGDALLPVAPTIPRVVLLTDDAKCREATELKALCGDRLVVVLIGEKMLRPRPEDVLVALVHDLQGGVAFMAEDPIIRPHASAGGTAFVDTLLYTILEQIKEDDWWHGKAPEIQIVRQNDLTAGLEENARIPWHGSPRKHKVTREVTEKRGKREVTRTVTKEVSEHVTRFLKGTPREENPRAIATDIEMRHTAILEDAGAGRLVVLDLVTLDGRAGLDPGCKNKLLFISRALGTGPHYARYRPGRPDYTTVFSEMSAFAEANQGAVKLKVEGSGSGKDTTVHSLTLGAEDKPLVVLVGGFQGTDWIAVSALLRLAEVLVENPHRDPTIPWLLQRLQVRIVPLLNPHGYDTESELNAKGVDLDQNFPYQWDAAPEKARRGREPLSEPESFILKRLVQDKKAVAYLQVDADPYEQGYRLVRARDLDDRPRALLTTLGTLVNARLRHRFIVNGDSPLQLRLTRDKERPSAINWAGSLGVLAASLHICGDGEDSLVNHDVAVETALHFLQVVALSLEKPAPREPAAPPASKGAPAKAAPAKKAP